MVMKRPAGGGDESDKSGSIEAKRRVDELLRSEPPRPSTSSLAASGRREMQGQSAEGGKHSIDSDEEEEYERTKQVEKMTEEDFEGIEDRTIDRDGEIQITPFNLKEEEEEGHFGKDGNFIWKKKGGEDEATDNWLENIDWGKVEERSEAVKARREEDDEKEAEAEALYDESDSFRQLLTLLQPKESVAKALRRLGGGKKTTAQKLKEKKRQKEGKETEQERANREGMTKLTALADAILTRSGHMEIYEETYESIAFKLKEEEARKRAKESTATAAAATKIPDNIDDDDALDMFMESAKEREASATESDAEKSKKTQERDPTPISLEEEVRWEFRWKDDDSEKLHGPHTSEEMLKWKDSGFFDKGVLVRKVGSQQDFSDGKRIDFDLYT